MDGKTGCFACLKQPIVQNAEYLYSTFSNCVPTSSVSRPLSRICMDHALHDRVYCLFDNAKYKHDSRNCDNFTKRVNIFNNTELAVCVKHSVTNYFDAQEIFVLIFSGASLVLLVISLFFLVCCTKTARPRRIDVLKHLFIASSIRVIGSLIYQFLRIKSVNLQCQQGSTCKLLSVLVEFATSAECSWMAVLGFYYLRLSKGFMMKIRLYLVICLVTWFVPGLIAATWILIMEYSGDNCWCVSHFCHRIWMIDVPNIFCLVLALALLLPAWYHTNRPSRIVEYRLQSNLEYKSAICFSTIFVIYLLAIQVFRLTDAYTMAFTHLRLTRTPIHIPDILTSVSGIVVSLILCFVDKEACQFCRPKKY